MANPRKFSEKIALHTHRQAEGTALFEQIMKEVSDATARVDRQSKNTLRIINPCLGTFRGGSLPNVSAGTAPTPSLAKAAPQKIDTVKVDEPVNPVYRSGARPRSQGGPIRRPHDRRLDTSPYSSGPFLSPPPDTSWRRTNSDSALHQSAMQGKSGDRNDSSGRGWSMSIQMNGPDTNNGRPRSSCEVPRVPGIHIYPSSHIPNQIPISGNNTGSLPDLTNVDFSSPIHAPLDQDHDQGSSPYSSSPVNTSPSTLSPTSIPHSVRHQGSFHFTHHPQQNHLSVPANSSYHHQQNHNKNAPLDKNLSNLVDGEFSQYNTTSQMYQQQTQCPSASPPPMIQQGAVYRSPRPSPQSSPSLGGRHSAPCSPGAPSPLSNDYQLFNQHQASQFQQHFEQLSMLDTPVSTMSYVDQPNVQLTNQQSHNHPHSQQNHPDGSNVSNIELTSDPGYYSTSPSSQIVYQTAPPSLHTTPNTPTSIPDIILTDFSSGTDDTSRQDLTKQLESEFFSEESLREGLGPIVLDDLQMLSDPGINLIPDHLEDHFRFDRS